MLLLQVITAVTLKQYEVRRSDRLELSRVIRMPLSSHFDLHIFPLGNGTKILTNREAHFEGRGFTGITSRSFWSIELKTARHMKATE